MKHMICWKRKVLNQPRLKTLAQSILEKFKVVKSFDEAILKTCKVEEIELKKELYEIKERTLETQQRIMDVLAAVEMGSKSDMETGGIYVLLVSLESPPISGD